MLLFLVSDQWDSEGLPAQVLLLLLLIFINCYFCVFFLLFVLVAIVGHMVEELLLLLCKGNTMTGCGCQPVPSTKS